MPRDDDSTTPGPGRRPRASTEPHAPAKPVVPPARDGAAPRGDWRDELEAHFRDAERELADGTIRTTGRVLGAGSEAVVLQALDDVAGPLALRVLAPRRTADEAGEAARLAAVAGGRCRVPAVAGPPLDVWAEPVGRLWHPVVALPFVDGLTLHELLAVTSPLRTSEALLIAIAIARVVDQVHRGVNGGDRLVHGDLGLENVVVLVDRDDPVLRPPSVALLDVGGATPLGARAGRAARLNRLTVTREQLLGEPLDQRTDVAAIGRLVSIMLSSGIVPDASFHAGLLGGPELQAMLRAGRNLTPLEAAELDRVIEAANADARTTRQPDAGVLADDLDAWLWARPTSRTPDDPDLLEELALERTTDRPAVRDR